MWEREINKDVVILSCIHWNKQWVWQGEEPVYILYSIKSIYRKSPHFRH